MKKKTLIILAVIAILGIANYATSVDASKPSKYKTCMDQCKAGGGQFSECNPKCSEK